MKAFEVWESWPENRVFWTDSRNRGGPSLRKSGALLRICFDKKYIIDLLAFVRFVNDFIYNSLKNKDDIK